MIKAVQRALYERVFVVGAGRLDRRNNPAAGAGDLLIICV